MGTQQNTIVILGIIAAIIVVLFIAFRNFKLGDALGLPNLQKGIDDISKNINDSFGGFVDFVSSPFQDDPNRLSGKTIDVSDVFGEGAKETFSDGTTIDEEGRIDSPGGKELQLSPEDENLVNNFFDTQATIRANTQKLIDKNNLTKDEVSQVNKLATDFVRLNVSEGTPRDSFGLIDAAFTAPAITLRATQQFLNNKRGAFRDKKTGKTVSFGGFDSALAQEKALRDTLAKSRAANPEYFKKLDAQRQAALKKKQ